MVQAYCCLQNSRHCHSPDFKFLSLMKGGNWKQVNSVQREYRGRIPGNGDCLRKDLWREELGR